MTQNNDWGYREIKFFMQAGQPKLRKILHLLFKLRQLPAWSLDNWTGKSLPLD